jgi:hypothetical protein
MIAMELKAGEGVCIGSHTLRVLEIRNGEVVVALVEAEPVVRRCPICEAEVAADPCGKAPEDCPRCGCSLTADPSSSL